MKLYSIRFSVKENVYSISVEASSKVYARRKIARKLKVDERSVKLLDVAVVGYF